MGFNKIWNWIWNSPQGRFRGGWGRMVGCVHVLIEGGVVREELRHPGHTRVPVSGWRHEAGTKGTWSRQTIFHWCEGEMITWVRDISHQRLKSAVIFQIRREGRRGRGPRTGEREQRLGGGGAQAAGAGGRGHVRELLAWNNIDIKCPQMLDGCRGRPRLPILLRDNSQLWISWESDFCFLVQNWSGAAISLSLRRRCSLGCDLLTLRKYYSELSFKHLARKILREKSNIYIPVGPDLVFQYFLPFLYSDNYRIEFIDVYQVNQRIGWSNLAIICKSKIWLMNNDKELW